MSVLHLLRMPTQSSRGELRIVDKDQREAFGHFVLHCIDPYRRDLPEVRLYFSYEFNPRLSDVAQDHSRAALMAELLKFYNAISAIHFFGPYALKHIDLPMGVPLSLKDVTLSPL